MNDSPPGYSDAPMAPSDTPAGYSDTPSGGGDSNHYSNQIATAAAKHGVRADVLTNLIRTESDFNPKARSPVGAVGIAQFMPGTAKTYGIDPTNPDQSIDAAARYIATSLKHYKGDYPKAVASYNAGIGGVDKKGISATEPDYVKKVLGGTNLAMSDSPPGYSDSPPPGYSDKPQQQVKTAGMVDASGAGDTIRKGANAVASATFGPKGIVRAANKEINQTGITLGSQLMTGMKLMDNLLGAPERFVEGTANEAANHGSLWQNISHGVDVATHPMNEELQSKELKSYTDRMTHLVGLNPNDKGAKRLVEEFAVQLASDPMTYMPVLNILKVGTKASEVMRVMKGAIEEFGPKHPVRQLFDAAHTVVQKVNASDMAASVRELNQVRKDTFSIRPELDKVLTKEGKAARLSIEARYEGETDFAKRKKLIDNKMAEFLRENPEAYKPGFQAPPPKTRLVKGVQTAIVPKTPPDLHLKAAKNLTYKGEPFGKDSFVTKLSNSAVSRVTRGAFRYGITGDPLPHGVKNVGGLALLAGGPETFARGLVHAVDFGRATVNVDRTGQAIEGATTLEGRMKDLGLMTDYGSGHGFPLPIPGVKQLAEGGQYAVERIENGMRAATLEKADRLFGPSKTLADEYNKAQFVRDYLGDYRNVSAVVSAFKALGGPFVAFRLGIVPRALTKALTGSRNAPRAWAEIIPRVQNDVNTPSTGIMKNGERLEIGGPQEDFGRALNPTKWMETPGGYPGYLTSPASLGVFGTVGSAIHQATLGRFDPLAVGSDALSNVNPFGFIMNPIGAAMGMDRFTASGRSPEQSPLARALAQEFGSYFAQQSIRQKKAEIKTRRSSNRRTNKSATNYATAIRKVGGDAASALERAGTPVGNHPASAPTSAPPSQPPRYSDSPPGYSDTPGGH